MSSFRKDYSFLRPPQTPIKMKPLLRVAIAPAPAFTLISLACLTDFLRHCADESNYSRQVYCSWTLLSHNRKKIRASCGFEIQPQSVFAAVDPRDFDVIVVHGGLLHTQAFVPDELYDFIKHADSCGVPLVGLCTGSFILAELGLLNRRRCAVHFTLFDAMQRLFPQVIPVMDAPVVRDGAYTTCASGLAAMNLAALIVKEHIGQSRVYKAEHYLYTGNGVAVPNDVMLQEDALASLDRRLSNAVGLMRQHMCHPYAIRDLARKVGTTERNLSRLFIRYLKISPLKYWRDMRLEMARHLIMSTALSVGQIAFECGFVDDSHLAKRFSEKYGLSPSAMRKTHNKAGIS